MASSSSSRLLATAVLTALFAGAMSVVKVSFTVEKGSDAKKLVLEIDYTGPGDNLAEVELRQYGSEEWQPLTKKGDLWEVSCSKALVDPFNLRFLSKNGMRNVFDQVFSTDFQIGKTYASEE
ncbi:pollen allergen Dac g 3-like [Hordeum vulgare subsp. vulgare]|uniref:Expansin-like CBD domain-containing protein n=1 Tax=Hordeum vulgare subsp. vulgare TaxID=112509 RepID=A0A8I6XTP9_HORVV|nr:pollen allergen Dac g 3-like [Hordeum vulgare subsp. vulgare]